MMRIDRRRTKCVVAIPFDNVAAGIGEMGNAPFVVLLLEIPVPLIICPVRAALDDFVDPFPIHVKANQATAGVVLQNRVPPVITIIGSASIVHCPFHASTKCVVGEIVS